MKRFCLAAAAAFVLAPSTGLAQGAQPAVKGAAPQVVTCPQTLAATVTVPGDFRRVDQGQPLALDGVILSGGQLVCTYGSARILYTKSQTCTPRDGKWDGGGCYVAQKFSPIPSATCSVTCQ